MATTKSDLVTLSQDDCLRRLTTHRPRLGRLAFHADGRTVVHPMNFLTIDQLSGRRIV